MLSASVTTQGYIDQATTKVGNLINKVNSGVKDMVGRVLSSPVANNPDVMVPAIDSGAALIEGTTPPSTPYGQATLLTKEVVKETIK